METLNYSKLTNENLITLLHECNDVNIELPNGFITLSGGLKYGILSKVENNKEYIWIGEKWVQV